MSDPLGFLITFRTYGTWLHGDVRGAVDADQNVYGEPLMPADEIRHTRAHADMRSAPAIFSDEMRVVVDQAILDECAHRGWELMERTVRTNHVHVVIAFAGMGPEQMVQELKARATRWLREGGLARLIGPSGRQA